MIGHVKSAPIGINVNDTESIRSEKGSGNNNACKKKKQIQYALCIILCNVSCFLNRQNEFVTSEKIET